MDETRKYEGLQRGVDLLNIAFWFVKYQTDQGREFVFEHPHRATSFRRDCVKQQIAKKNTKLAKFDQCMFGLKTKTTKTPMKKTTLFLTNCAAINQKFNGVMCDGCHEHCKIDGYEGGERRSIWAQRYPQELCEAIADAVMN